MDHLIPYLLVAICSISCFFLLSHLSHAAPIKPPDLKKCAPAFASRGPLVNITYHCCLPLPKRKAVSFSFKKSPRRVRRPAHLADDEYMKKYNKAYELMRALPSNDPRSFSQQADVHCAFCNGAYKQAGTNVTLQVHVSWLFLIWHRWYLYFHESILARLLGDPDFALLFWNWDNQVDGNTMPAFFAINGTAVYDSKRNQNHLPPTLVRLNVLSTSNNSADIIADNLNHMYQSVVTASTAELFMGGAYRTGTDLSNSTGINAPLGGSIENGAHDAIHVWTGDPRQSLQQDMGVFSTAARDPIFYTHHSNVDRLWDVWRYSLPGGQRKDHSDPDFLNAEFVFYDEHANLIKVKARDALSSKKLGIKYTKVKADNLWINYSPNSTTSANSTAILASDIEEIVAATDDSSLIKLGKRFSAWVRQPKLETNKLEGLTIQGVEVEREFFIQLLVYVNLPDANKDTKANSAEYVGTFNILPTASKSKRLMTNLKFEIGDNIKRIGLQDQKQVIITILVRTYKHHHHPDVKIKGMKIKYE